MGTSVDVLIAGGGPVGAFLGLSLAHAPLSVLHVDSAQPGAERPIALSHGSRLLLEARDVFRHISNTPIKTIRVSQRGAFGRVLISAEEHRLPALGYVADYGSIRTAINRESAPHAGRLSDWSATQEGVAVSIIDSHGNTQDLHTQLLVLADGETAFLSPDGGAKTESLVTRDYAQFAIVAQVRTKAHHHNTAHERFTRAGPLALLPNRDGFALVWCVNREAAPGLLLLDEKSFLLKLRDAFGSHLGEFVDAGQRTGFPLSLRYLKADLGPRVLAIGNAAQSLHPVAGQGLNLGLRDVWELASHLVDRPALIAQSGFARDFMRQRRADRRLEIGLTDSLVRVFSRQESWLAALRGAALLAIDTVPPARRLLARTMMYGLRSNRRI